MHCLLHLQLHRTVSILLILSVHFSYKDCSRFVFLNFWFGKFRSCKCNVKTVCSISTIASSKRIKEVEGFYLANKLDRFYKNGLKSRFNVLTYVNTIVVTFSIWRPVRGSDFLIIYSLVYLNVVYTMCA